MSQQNTVTKISEEEILKIFDRMICNINDLNADIAKVNSAVDSSGKRGQVGYFARIDGEDFACLTTLKESIIASKGRYVYSAENFKCDD